MEIGTGSEKKQGDAPVCVTQVVGICIATLVKAKESDVMYLKCKAEWGLPERHRGGLVESIIIIVGFII